MAFGDPPEEYAYDEEGNYVGLTPYGKEAKATRREALEKGVSLTPDGVFDEINIKRFMRDQFRFRSLLCWAVIVYIIHSFNLLTAPAPAAPITLISLVLLGLAITSPFIRKLAVGCLAVFILFSIVLTTMITHSTFVPAHHSPGPHHSRPLKPPH